MAESADALASGASGGNLVEVQVFLPAPNILLSDISSLVSDFFVFYTFSHHNFSHLHLNSLQNISVYVIIKCNTIKCERI